MPRRLRRDHANAFHHVTNRGNHGADIFRGDEDRRDYLAQLGAVLLRQDWRCHAYCLMGNHYHLLLETPQANLADGMQWFSAVLTQRFNRRHGLTGHLFQGRYKSVAIETDAHLLEAVRYIALNPVRAGMVARAEDWPWSQHRALAGLAPAPEWLSCSWLWEQLAVNEADAQAAYSRFVAEGRELQEDRQAPWLERPVPAARPKTPAVADAQLAALARSGGDRRRWMHAARARGYSQAAIAAAGRVSQATVSRILQASSKSE